MRAIISNVVQLFDVPRSAAREIKSRLTLRNPEYEQRRHHGACTVGIPEAVIYYRELEAGEFVIPREALPIAEAAARRAGEECAGEDRTICQPVSDVHFTGVLRLYQIGAAALAMQRHSNVLHVPTGAGKTVLALWLAAERAQRTLVIVPTEKLLVQWIEVAAEFLELPAPVGVIGGGKVEVGDQLTVGIVDSVAKHIHHLQEMFGHLIVDECHRAPGHRYRQSIEACHARYRLGLSATPIRRDGMGPAIGWLLGPTIAVPAAPLVDAGAILPAEIEQRTTGFSTDLNASDNYAAVLYEVLADQERNQQIVADAMNLYRDAQGVTLLLTDHRGHCALLAAYLGLQGVECAVMIGGMSQRKQEFFRAALADGRIRTIVATAKLVGEGWDYPGVGALLLTAPIKWEGKLIQAIGRALRPFPGMDRARIIDYVDHRVPQLRASARARARVYRKEIIQWKKN